MAKWALLSMGTAAALLPPIGLIVLRPYLPEYLALHAVPVAGLLLVFGWTGLLYHRGQRALGRVAYLFWLTAFFGLARVPWKYPYDFESYLLNIFLFPLFLVGLYQTITALFSKAWAYKICLPIFLLFVFPSKVFIKVLFDEPSPWGVVSPLLGILVLAGGYWLAVKTLDKPLY